MFSMFPAYCKKAAAAKVAPKKATVAKTAAPKTVAPKKAAVKKTTATKPKANSGKARKTTDNVSWFQVFSPSPPLLLTQIPGSCYC